MVTNLAYTKVSLIPKMPTLTVMMKAIHAVMLIVAMNCLICLQHTRIFHGVSCSQRLMVTIITLNVKSSKVIIISMTLWTRSVQYKWVITIVPTVISGFMIIENNMTDKIKQRLMRYINDYGWNWGVVRRQINDYFGTDYSVQQLQQIYKTTDECCIERRGAQLQSENTSLKSDSMFKE